MTRRTSNTRGTKMCKPAMKLVYKVISDTQLVFAQTERIKCTTGIRSALDSLST